MKNLKKLFILMLITITLVGCGKIPTLENGEEAVVTLEEGKISANSLYKEIKEKYGISVLVDLIDKTILEAKYKDDDDEKEYVENQVKSFKSAVTENITYEQILAYYGFASEQELKDYFSLTYKRNKAVNEYLATTIKEKEIKKYYEENIFGEINVKHILIAPETLDGMTTEETKAAEEKALKEAKEVIKKLKNGEDWDKLAEKYSSDSANAKKGGDLGWIATGDTEEEFENAAFALKKGTYTTSPIKTKYGYHIIYKVDEKEKPKYEDSKEGIIDTLVENKLNEDSTLYYKTLKQIRKDSKLDIDDSELKKDYDTYMNNLIKQASNS